jgi:diadenylate cyclase
MSFILTFWKPFLEIVILWCVFYRILLFFTGTRAVQVLKGVFIILVAFFVIQKLGLDRLSWILTKLFALSVIGFVVIFQPELRRGLARLGQHYFFGMFSWEEQTIDELIKAAVLLSKKKIGALVAIERETGLKPFIESGLELDSKVSSEMLVTIFYPTTPLHDGGVIIKEGRIVAASCLFPLSENPNIDKTLGMRHRAAIGISEETDAVCVVVSEETGAISVAASGRLIRDLDQERLGKIIRNLLRSKSLSSVFCNISTPK